MDPHALPDDIVQMPTLVRPELQADLGTISARVDRPAHRCRLVLFVFVHGGDLRTACHPAGGPAQQPCAFRGRQQRRHGLLQRHVGTAAHR
jgi:hypothetical protein